MQENEIRDVISNPKKLWRFAREDGTIIWAVFSMVEFFPNGIAKPVV